LSRHVARRVAPRVTGCAIKQHIPRRAPLTALIKLIKQPHKVADKIESENRFSRRRKSLRLNYYGIKNLYQKNKVAKDLNQPPLLHHLQLYLRTQNAAVNKVHDLHHRPSSQASIGSS